jgi:tRNA dimethylallyltransferase
VIGDFAILGATASGKTALAVELARRTADLELASVDAFACYRRLDIGTAKPDASERSGVSWHLIDIVDPTDEFSIAEFASLATSAAQAIHARGHAVGYVGGSGLYLRSVLDHLTPPPRFPDIAGILEARASAEGVEVLYTELANLDPIAATRMEPTNRRRIIRALEVNLGTGVAFSAFGPGMEVYPEIDTVLIGLAFDRGELDERIVRRLSAQLEAGFLDEVRDLVKAEVQLSRTAAQAIGYRELAEVVRVTMTLEEATSEILRRSRNLARRQLAWLRRDPRITWVDGTRDDLVDHVGSLIAQSRSARRQNVRRPDGPV